ncbi:MAG TPA: hypothetical protein VFD58_04335 [Blastocatellia bacterium]|nr:hypothetical protein [Blastocatellia bacterium]
MPQPSALTSTRKQSALWVVSLVIGSSIIVTDACQKRIIHVDRQAPGSQITSPAPSRRVTVDAYHRLRDGMSPEQVIAILGPPTAEQIIRGTEAEVFRWGDASSGAVVKVMFRGGKLVDRSQSGLQ